MADFNQIWVSDIKLHKQIFNLIQILPGSVKIVLLSFKKLNLLKIQTFINDTKNFKINPNLFLTFQRCQKSIVNVQKINLNVYLLLKTC